MSKRKRLFFIFILTAILLTVPMAALARKQVWKARLTTDAELHDVVGSSATGSAVFATNPDGSLHFVLFVRGLSGPATGAHIHAGDHRSERPGGTHPVRQPGPLRGRRLHHGRSRQPDGGSRYQRRPAGGLGFARRTAPFLVERWAGVCQRTHRFQPGR